MRSGPKKERFDPPVLTVFILSLSLWKPILPVLYIEHSRSSVFGRGPPNYIFSFRHPLRVRSARRVMSSFWLGPEMRRLVFVFPFPKAKGSGNECKRNLVRN